MNEIEELRKAATAIYIAVEKSVADDISAKLLWAANKTERLRAENAALLDQLMTARRQNEHILATIRKLYDDIRAEQETDR